jgi:hypothetical protein
MLGRRRIRFVAGLGLSLFFWFAGCATIAPPLPPSLELPKPPVDLRAVRKGDRVILSWTIPTFTTDRQRVRALGPTRVCRTLDEAFARCGTPVGEAMPLPAQAFASRPAGQKVTNTFTDRLPVELERGNRFGFVRYAVEVLNPEGRGASLSNLVSVPLAEALPPPADFAARVRDEGVVLSWSGPLLSRTYANPVSSITRVYRRAEGSQESILVGQVDVGMNAHPSLTDQSFEWEKTYFYHADTLTILRPAGKAEIQVVGDDSAEVKVFADDVFPPAVPSGVQAVFSGPGQAAFIDLIWAPVSEMDLAGYNVYRREEGGAAVKVNAELVKAPAYRDANVVSGKKYFYSVSSVDVRGNESARSEEGSERVP